MYDVNTLIAAIPLNTVVELVFYVALGIYAIFTAILYFHWNTYSVEPVVNKITTITYLLTTVPLLVVMSIVALTI